MKSNNHEKTPIHPVLDGESPFYPATPSNVPDEIVVQFLSYVTDNSVRVVSKQWRNSYDEANYKEKLRLLVGNDGIEILKKNFRKSHDNDQVIPNIVLWKCFNQLVSDYFDKKIVKEIFNSLIDFFKQDLDDRDEQYPWANILNHEIEKFYTQEEFHKIIEEHDIANRANVLRLFLSKLRRTLKDVGENKDLRSLILDNLPLLAMRHCAKLLGEQTILADQMTLVHYAVAGNYYNTVRYLLTYFPEYKPALKLASDKATPLLIACSNLNTDMVRLLIKFGSDVNSGLTVEDKGNEGDVFPPLMAVATYVGVSLYAIPYPNYIDKDESSRRLETYKTLIENGADVNILQDDILENLEEFLAEMKEESNSNKRKFKGTSRN